jgi:Insecticide toxin TcdB middle/C-terminal region
LAIRTSYQGDWDPAEFAAQDFVLDHPAPAARAGGALPVAAEHYAPPLETRTWLHLGPVGDGTGEWRELDLSGEYWAEDPNLLTRPAGTTALLRGLRRRQRRDAIRTLRGTTLRTELYARDGSARQLRPYTVTESLPGLARVLPTPGGGGDVQLAFAPPAAAS